MSGLPPRAARIRGIDAIAVDIPLSRNFGGSTYSVPKLSTEGDGLLSTAARSVDSTLGRITMAIGGVIVEAEFRPAGAGGRGAPAMMCS